MLSFILSCFALFGIHPWDACSFLKGDRGGVDLSKGVTGKSKGRGNCSQDVLYERRITEKKEEEEDEEEEERRRNNGGACGGGEAIERKSSG